MWIQRSSASQTLWTGERTSTIVAQTHTIFLPAATFDLIRFECQVSLLFKVFEHSHPVFTPQDIGRARCICALGKNEVSQWNIHSAPRQVSSYSKVLVVLTYPTFLQSMILSSTSTFLQSRRGCHDVSHLHAMKLAMSFLCRQCRVFDLTAVSERQRQKQRTPGTNRETETLTAMAHKQDHNHAKPAERSDAHMPPISDDGHPPAHLWCAKMQTRTDCSTSRDTDSHGRPHKHSQDTTPYEKHGRNYHSQAFSDLWKLTVTVRR